MRSARRRALIENKKNADIIAGILTKLILPAAVIVAAFLFFILGRNHWNGIDKFAVAYRLEKEDIGITVLDPKLDEATTLIIPGDTEVNVAQNLGTLRIKNVWQLGINEKIGGKLIPETITENFLFPVYLWGDYSVRGLGSGSLSDLMHFVFLPGSTNITFGDRLFAAFFAAKVPSLGRSTLDLGKSQFLTKTKLNDGQAGYTLTGPVSSRLTVYFSDNAFIDSANSGKNIRVQIEDATGEAGVAENVGQVVEVMGAKIIAIDKKGQNGGDCEVIGANQKIIAKISDVFSCKTKIDKGSENVVISLAKDFAKRY